MVQLPKYDGVIHIRITQDEKRLWESAAERRGLTLSDFIREIVGEKAREQAAAEKTT